MLAHLLSDPTPEQVACHAPKPILLNVGDIDIFCPWAPSIVSTQIFKVGNLYIVGVPGEFTTMSGRRLRASISNALQQNGISNPVVVIAGLSNDYTHYITTYQEYRTYQWCFLFYFFFLSRFLIAILHKKKRTTTIRGWLDFVWTSHSRCLSNALY
jgi:neutral ceramidase